MEQTNIEAKLDRTRLHVFSDFDGTITEQDTLIFLTNNLGGGPRLVEAIGRLIRQGALTLRDGIAAEMRSIRAPFAEAVGLLQARVRIDAGFPPFARWCEQQHIPLTVLSAGFRELIDLFIAAEDFPQVEILANSIQPNERIGWQCVFRDQTEFGHDKAQAIRAAQAAGHYVVFIGDGLSDRASAEVADEVFAKHSLIEYCRERGIAAREFQTFEEVLSNLQSRM